MTRVLLSSILVLSLAACTSTAPSPASSSLPLWAGLTPGQYSVGFIGSPLLTAPHPLLVSVWYPAGADGTPLRYGDYLKLSLWESGEKPTQENKTKALEAAKAFLTKNGVRAASADALIKAQMYARLNATVAPGSFPLVLVIQGNGQGASGQAVLCEFLASHGYVVATIPSITRMTGPMAAEKDIAPKAEEEVGDIERAVSSLAEWPNRDKSLAPSFVAHSFGSRSALFYAMHHPVTAIVSLEGGIGLATGQKSMVDSKMLDLTASIPPILHFYEVNDDQAVPDFRLLRSLHTPDLQLVRMNSMHHVHFSSDGFAAVMLPSMAKVTKGGPDLKKDVVSVARQTLAYLDKWTAAARSAS